MKISAKILIFMIILFASRTAMAGAVVENVQWKEVFTKYSTNGVLVLCKGTSASCVTNDKLRAAKAYIPASTFKIANALIALETGVIESGRQVFKWDGRPRSMELWEQDFILRGAIQFSVVPVFQQFAQEIGKEKMKTFLSAFDYGNANIGGGIDRFWLDGGLRISALNQVRFLESLYQGTVPISERNQLIVKDALTSEAAPGYLVRSKTGYSGVNGKVQPAIAWWVGWVEAGTEVYYFAFNMDVHSSDALPSRKRIPIEIMNGEGVPIGVNGRADPLQKPE
jgi:beta-lactamase class D OXA-10